MEAFFKIRYRNLHTILFVLLTGANFASAEELVPLPIELPKPFFGGTPYDGSAYNLEEATNKPREAYNAPAGTTIVSKGKPVTASRRPIIGSLRQITDGDKRQESGSQMELPEGLQWVQVDLEESKEIYAILLWHSFSGHRFCYSVIVQTSCDESFKDGVTTVFDNDIDNFAKLGAGQDKYYFERFEGRLIDAKGVKARYIRFYSRGSTGTDKNCYIEAEVWGK